LLFINGNTINVPATELTTVKELCEQIQLDAETCIRFAEDPAKLQLLTMLINQGYWYFVE
jgi:50S ribosomal protein L16 3-hydroxylase